ncbi:MAG: nuclear transport factor 2 family protein [Casimicrobiaceae bacterium]|nr:nuclear transport factor 2 family protein [Casimicrobiaceae bacterium]
MKAAIPEALAPLVTFYETLTEDALTGLDRIYTSDARFKDPFNEVTGTAAIAAIFRHMYATTLDPRFVVTSAALTPDAREGFLLWEFHFRIRRHQPEVERLIRGATHVHLAPDGRVAMHRDYWDAAEELYEKLPVIGALMRFLRRRMA